MRKPRDFDAELQALTDKAKMLKTKKQSQLGELVAATGADNLSMEQLAGALIDAVRADASRKEPREAWLAHWPSGPTAARRLPRCPWPATTTPPCGQRGVIIG